jgi:prepilin-type processing-associated H-X9-DG protein
MRLGSIAHPARTLVVADAVTPNALLTRNAQIALRHGDLKVRGCYAGFLDGHVQYLHSHDLPFSR